MPIAFNSMRRRALLSAVLAASLPTAAHGAPARALAGAAPCATVSFEVALAPGASARYRVVGALCAPVAGRGRTVQILLSGATYTRSYWDWPVRPQTYSYVRALTAAGYATLDVDRIGQGSSDYPPAVAVTIASNAFVTHQLVGAMRQRGFAKVVLVGHSSGSGIALVEAARYADVDGVITSGFLNGFAPGAGALFNAAIYPASQDPRLRARGLPTGYLTTRPGTRGIFDDLANTDADVLARDEATKGTTTLGELAGYVSVVTGDIARRVRVPVLSVEGEDDVFFCASPACPQARRQRAAYAPGVSFQLVVLPDAGHDLALERNAPTFFAIARHWADQFVGTGATGAAGVR